MCYTRLSVKSSQKVLKKALDKIVNINQSAFIPGRSISDNILVTQELLRGYDRKFGLKRCAMKIDLQKAYDTIRWKFIKDFLIHFGFPDKMVNWIMSCITGSVFSISINAELQGYFKGARGLRQGDPISPYLFTIVMEVLTLIMKRKVEDKKEFKYHWGCRSMKLTHLCFADDLLMVCHGDMKLVKIIKEALDEFSSISGLLPNEGKSTLFFGSVDEVEKQGIKDIMGFKEGKLPVRYLGVPLIAKIIGVKDCKILVDKVRSRINDWKNKSLTFAGRLQLLTSVLTTMQVYWMAVFKIPNSVVKELQKLFKNFLWSGGESKRNC